MKTSFNDVEELGDNKHFQSGVLKSSSRIHETGKGGKEKQLGLLSECGVQFLPFVCDDHYSGPKVRTPKGQFSSLRNLSWKLCCSLVLY